MSPARSLAAETDHLSRTSPRPEPGTWNIHYAVAHLLDHLRTLPAPLSSPKWTVITKSSPTPLPGEEITAARAFPVSPHAWRSYPSLIFASLGTSVFDGMLDERVVELAWANLDMQVSGRTVVIGGPEKTSAGNGRAVGGRKEGNVKVKVKIELNAMSLQGANRDEIVGTLLHHMIHAYLVVVCGSVETCSRGHESDYRDSEGVGSDGGKQDNNCGKDEDCLAHGNAFAAILWEIRAQAAKCEVDRERPLPIGFGHRLPSAFPQCLGYPSHKPPRRFHSTMHANKCSTNSTRSSEFSSIASPAPDRHPRDSTHCPVSVPVINLDSVSNWYATECAPFLTAPTCMRGSDLYAYSSRKGRLYPVSRHAMSCSSSAHVTFVYDGDKPIGVLRATVERFASLRVNVFASGKCWVELPRTGVWKEQLGALMDFLKSDTYHPAVRLRAGGGGDQGGCEGTKEGAWLSGCDAAVIDVEVRTRRHYRKAQGPRTNARGVGSQSRGGEKDDGNGHGHEARAHLHDIRVHRLASAIGFSELATYAIRRLHAHQTLLPDEDPIELLENIYFHDDSKEVQLSQQLRGWARAFLSRCEDGSSMVSNMTKLQKCSQWRKRWRALLARDSKQGQSLLEDVRAVDMQDVAGKQQWGRRQREAQGMRYVGYSRRQGPWYTHDLAAESSDASSASTSKSSHGDDCFASAKWPYGQFNYATKHKQGFGSQSPPVQSNGYAPHFPGWWNVQNHLYPYPHSYPFSLSPYPAPPLFQYYAATQPSEWLHQQARPQSQSGCEDSVPRPGDLAADAETTMSEASTEGAANGCYVAAKENGDFEPQRKATRHNASDRARRRKAQPKSNVEWRTERLPQRQRHSSVTQRLW